MLKLVYNQCSKSHNSNENACTECDLARINQLSGPIAISNRVIKAYSLFKLNKITKVDTTIKLERFKILDIIRFEFIFHNLFKPLSF